MIFVFRFGNTPCVLPIPDLSLLRVRKHLMVLFLGLMISAGAKEQIPDFKTVAEGVEYREVFLDRPRTISIVQLRCDPTKIKFNLLLGSDRKKGKTATAQEMLTDFGQIAVINSSYFGHQDEILGYAERLGMVLNSEVAQDGIFSAFFFWDGNRAGFKRRGEALPTNVPVLFQSGPRLVWDSQPVEGLDDEALANRSGLSIDREGRITLFAVGVTSRVSLAELPELLLRPVHEGGVAATRALNLDGGKSTQFCLSTPSRKTYLPGFVKVPVFLGVSTR
jgi:Phosphodiester glycosidase